MPLNDNMPIHIDLIKIAVLGLVPYAIRLQFDLNLEPILWFEALGVAILNFGRLQFGKLRIVNLELRILGQFELSKGADWQAKATHKG